MRALPALLVPLPFLAGCLSWLFPNLDSQSPCSPPRDLTPAAQLAEYDLLQPEGGVDFGGDPKYVPLQPTAFAEDSWAAEAIAKIKPHRAPALDSDIAQAGSVLVCSFEVAPVPGIDGIDTPSGPLVRSSTPDLLVWADFAGQKVNKGPVLSSTRGTFAYRVSLKEGDPIHFGFGDYDFFSANDGIGSIEGRYRGELPFDIQGRVGSARCHAIPPSFIAAERTKWRSELTEASRAFEAYAPTLEAPISWDLAGRVKTALAAVLYFEQKDVATESELIKRLEDASRKQWLRYLEMLRDKRNKAPAPGTWVSLNDMWDARVPGLLCRTRGDGIPLCNPALEIRWKKDPVALDCHERPDFFGQLGQVTLMDSHGETTSPLMSDAQRNGVWARTEADLWAAKKGNTMLVSLFGGGIFYRKSKDGWDIPFVAVNGVYLRVY